MSSFNEVYERIKFATNTRTQVELADVLDYDIVWQKRRDNR